MSVIDTPTQTHHDSIGLHVDTIVAETGCLRGFAPHVEIHQCADPKLRIASEAPPNHFVEKGGTT